jgi:predicted RNA binding protein YcfA (HicA-like mRNA interferase family)
MGAGFYRDVRALLIKHGCIFVRQGKGSHEVWKNPATNKQFVLSVTVASRLTANGILKQAGIAERV